MNFESDTPEAILEDMNAAMARVTAAYVSPSIRDADMNGIHINNGDTIGIINKEIVLSDPTRREAANKLASMLLGMPDKFMLTVFCGEDSNADEQSELTAYLAKEFGALKFTVNEEDADFVRFNFKPASDYTYTAGDEAKLICMNEGYETYWDAATGTFRLQAI
jgi:dihydroxyacetone kinase-like predicted kinase